jgi:hypothetical protein
MMCSLLEINDPADRRAVPEKPFSDAGFFFPVWPFAAKGKGATTKRGHKGAEEKSFCSPSQKLFAGVHLTPFCLNRRCYDQPSAQGLAGTQGSVRRDVADRPAGWP